MGVILFGKGLQKVKTWKKPEINVLGVSLNENIAASQENSTSTVLEIFTEGDDPLYPNHFHYDVANGVIEDTQYTYFAREYPDYPNVHYGSSASYDQVSSCKTNNY